MQNCYWILAVVALVGGSCNPGTSNAPAAENTKTTAQEKQKESEKSAISRDPRDTVVDTNPLAPPETIIMTDGIVAKLDDSTLRDRLKYLYHRAYTTDLVFNAAGTRLAGIVCDSMSLLSNCAVRFWNVATWQTLAIIKQSEGEQTPSVLAYSPDAKRLAIGQYNGDISILCTDTYEKIATLKGHAYTVKDMHFSPDGNQLISSAEDNTIRIWDTHTHTEIGKMKNNLADINRIALSPNGREVAVTWNAYIRILDVKTRKRIRMLGPVNYVSAIAYAPNGAFLASASGDGMVRLWDITKRKPMAEVKVEHSPPIESLAVSMDGTRLAVGTQYDNIIVFDTTPLGQLAVFNTNSTYGIVNTVGFSPDSRMIVSGVTEGATEVWDAVALGDTSLKTLVEFSRMAR